jgi:hypothetical protein
LICGTPIVERLKAGIAIGLQEAGEFREMACRMLAAAIRAVEVGGRRRRGSAKRTIVTHIDPQPPGLGPAETRRKDRQGGVVAVDLCGREHVPSDPLDDRP